MQRLVPSRPSLPASWGGLSLPPCGSTSSFPLQGSNILIFSHPHLTPQQTEPDPGTQWPSWHPLMAAQPLRVGMSSETPALYFEGDDMHSYLSSSAWVQSSTLGTLRVMLGNVFNPSAPCFVVYKNEGYANTV